MTTTQKNPIATLLGIAPASGTYDLYDAGGDLLATIQYHAHNDANHTSECAYAITNDVTEVEWSPRVARYHRDGTVTQGAWHCVRRFAGGRYATTGAIGLDRLALFGGDEQAWNRGRAHLAAMLLLGGGHGVKHADRMDAFRRIAAVERRTLQPYLPTRWRYVYDFNGITATVAGSMPSRRIGDAYASDLG